MHSSLNRLLLGRSVRDRMSRAMALAVALPLVTVAVYITVSQRSIMADQAEEQLAGHASREAAFVQSLLEQAAGDIEVIAANPVLASPEASLEEISSQLQQSQAFFERFEDLTLLDVEGSVIASNGYLYYGPWAPRAVFREALLGRTSASEVQRIPAGDKYVLVFAAPVFHDLELRGVIAGQMNMQRIWDELDSFAIGDSGFLAAFDGAGNLVAWPDKALLLTRLEGGPNVLTSRDQTTFTLRSPDGGEYVAVLSDVGLNGWRVGALQGRGEVYAVANDTALQVAVAVAIVFLCATAILFWFPKAIASPLHRLGFGMQRIAEGDFGQRLPRTDLAEIDDLASAFNQMAENLAIRIEEQKRTEQQIRYRAEHDRLTGLPNRELISKRTNEAVASARVSGGSVGVLLLDLDRFKGINDSVGHAIGDQLLQAVAERLTRLLPEGCTAARMGGDEFLILLPSIVDPEYPDELCTRILRSFATPWTLGGHEFRVTASVGIAVSPEHGDDAATLMRNADTAMYRAKESGRDRHVRFVPLMNADLLTEVELERDLGRAIERQELRVHFQPQVRIETGEIMGLEALVRWEHPTRGLLMPDRFIPLAEASGMIVSLGDWVLRAACRQAVAWKKQRLGRCRVAVNVSARELQEANFYQRVEAVIRETGIDPDSLDLEITEGTAMRDIEYTISSLARLRNLGVHVSIDDFGSGYSSLGYLSRLPVDAVKIDRTFVTRIKPDSEQASIVGAIVALASRLNLRVVAEGVEDPSELAVLRSLGCEEYQGYLFSKPQPVEGVVPLLRKWATGRPTPGEAA